MKKKKLYLVKREVLAGSLKEAMSKHGEIYEITLAEEKFQPEDTPEVKGFKTE